MSNTADLESLVLSISADVRQVERAMRRMEGQTARSAKAVERQFDLAAERIDKRLGSIGGNFTRNLASPALAIGSVLGGANLIRLTDTWTDLNSRVRLAAGGMQEGVVVMDRLSEMARRTYSSLEMTTESYLSNSRSLKELGYSITDQLDYTEALNNALVVSAAKGDRAAAVQNALAKAMAGGTLSGQDLNTVIEQGGRVAEALAAGLGVGVNELRKLGQQGGITSRAVFQALTSQMVTLREEAEQMPATISDGVQLLQNAFLEYVGKGDEAQGISAKISEALVIMADNFDQTADAALALAGVLAGALIGRSLAGMIAKLGLAGAALVKFTAALAAARNMAALTAAFAGVGAAAGPVGLLIGGAVVGALTVFSLRSSEASNAADAYAKALDSVRDSASETAEQFEQTAEAANTLRDTLEGAIDLGEQHLARLTAALQAHVDLLDHHTMQEYISTEQIAQLRSMVDGFDGTEEGAKRLRAEVLRLGNVDIDLSGLLDPLLDQINEVIAAIRVMRNERDEAVRQDDTTLLRRGGEDASMQALREMQAATTGYISEAERRNSLTRDQLALENEIARVRKDADEAGVVMSARQIENLARSNLGANDRRTAEGRSRSGGSRTKAERQNEYERETEQIAARINAINAETAAMAGLDPLVDDYGFALEKARAAHELLTAAQRAGLAITPELRADMDRLAETYASATVNAVMLAEAQQIAVQRAEEMRDTGRDVMKGYVTDVVNGVSATEALANSLKKVGDRLLDIALDGLFDPKMKSSGGGGGLLAGIGKILGFAKGTANTGGRRGEVRGLVHGQEAVIPLPTGGQVPVDLRFPRSMPGPVPPAQSAGGNVFHIDARGAQQGVGEEIKAALEAYDRNLNRTIGTKIAGARGMNRTGF